MRTINIQKELTIFFRQREKNPLVKIWSVKKMPEGIKRIKNNNKIIL